MKLGRPVFSTRVPFTQPIPIAKRKVTGMAMVRGSPSPPNSPGSLTSRTTSIPVAPVMAPDERSNSPPIISNATAIAMIPSEVATSR